MPAGIACVRPRCRPRRRAGSSCRPRRAARGVIKKNAGASLVDLGDGVVAVEFHSKMNTIGGDTIEMVHAGLAEASRQTALVIGAEAELFSAGANVMLLLLEAQEGNWDEIDRMVRAFQGMTMALKTRAGSGRRRAERAGAGWRLRDLPPR